MQIIVPSLVPLPLVPRAVAASATANQSATIAGPALGGLLYTAGPSVVYGVCLALFAAAVLLTAMIRIERMAPSREPMTLKAFFAGFAFIRRSPAIFGVISLDLFAVLLGGVTALLPVFARDVFAAGPWGLGLLRAAPAVGALTMALALTRWPIERNAGKMMFAAVAGFGLAAIVFASTERVRGRARGARGARRLRHGERRDPHDPGAARHARRGARPRHRGERPLHRRVESARRIPRRRDGVADRRGAGRAGRRHRHADHRGDVDEAVSGAVAREQSGGRQGSYSAASSRCCGFPIASQWSRKSDSQRRMP